MINFIPRLEIPSTKNSNYIHHTKGGKNLCILIQGDSVIPNCVGYSWGRWHELLGEQPKLSRGNAENWWGFVQDGYERGQTPKLGAIACWQKGRAGYAADGAGHVAVVEDILEDGSIVTSNSNYKGTPFFMRTFKPPYSLGTTYGFQGFIYPPKEFVFQPVLPLKPIKDIAKEVIAGKWGDGADRRSKLTAAGYDAKKVQTMVNTLLRTKEVTPPPTTTQLAKEVIAGKWGSGKTRRNKLTAAGHDYTAVQVKVNQLLALTIPKKSNDTVAREVIRGVWGNGKDRKNALIKAGYDYNAVQFRVNQLLK